MQLTMRLASVLIALGFFCQAHAAEVRVAVAANFNGAMLKIAAEFEKDTQHKAVLVSGSTGAFFHQITQGAPFDVLLAADDTTPTRLEKEGFGVEGSRFTYSIGKLALWSRQTGFVDPTGDVLKAGKFDKIALANPALAPYGAAAIQTLANLGVLNQVMPKVVQGDNIAQTYLFVSTGNAPLGFVALSQIFADGRMTEGSAWIVPANLYGQIRQEAVVLKRARDNAAAQSLMVYLRSSKARAIIKSHGYEY